jgi:hypothetical protein
VCRNLELHEHARISLPANFRVLDMPEATQAQDRFIDFHSQYSFDPLTNVVTMTRDGSTHFDSDVCTPDDFAQMRPAVERVERDVRAEVIVKSTLVEPSNVAAFSPSTPSSSLSPFAP